MRKDCPHWINRTAAFVLSMFDEETGGFRSVPDGPTTLYGTCYALLTEHYLRHTRSVPRKTREFITSCQEQNSGLMIGPELRYFESSAGDLFDREHLVLHSTCAALPICQQFSLGRLQPVKAAHRFCDSEYLRQWLDQRDLGKAWLEGNNILFVGQLLIYLRDVELHPAAQGALNIWFDWLDRRVDEATGLWGTNGFSSLMDAAYGGYHQLLVYCHENREIRSPNALVNAVLSLQHADGGFNPYGNGGACEDVDCVDILVNLYKRFDYRRNQIRFALRRCLTHILSTQNSDGGYPYNRNCPQKHMAIPGTEGAPNQSTMFATWFRTHTLALMAEVLVDEPSLAFSFNFTGAFSMGWHRKWNKREHTLTPADRQAEARFAFLWKIKKLRYYSKRICAPPWRRLRDLKQKLSASKQVG